VAIVLVVLLVPGTYLAIYAYARSIIDGAEVRVVGLRLMGVEGESIRLKVDCVVENPSSRAAKIKPSDLDVYYQGELMGHIKVPRLELEGGKNRFSVHIDFMEESQGFLMQVFDLLLLIDIEVVIKGTIVTDDILSLKLPVDKTVPVDG